MAKTSKIINIVVSAAPSGLPSWLANANGPGIPASIWQWVTLTGPGATPGIAPNPLAYGGSGSLTNGADPIVVVEAYGGGCLRQNGSYFILHGGGHGDYSGNEVYTLKLSDNSPVWIRHWGPTSNANITSGVDPNNYVVRYKDGPSGQYHRYLGGYSGAADGNPASIHTVNILTYCPDQDAMYRMSGGSYGQPSGWFYNIDSWKFGAVNLNPTDRTAGKSQWTAGSGLTPPHPDSPYIFAPGASCYNTDNKRVYCWATIFRGIFDPLTNSWVYSSNNASVQLNDDAISRGMCYDPIRKFIWCFGRTSGQAQVWNTLDNTLSTPTVSGAPGDRVGCTAVYDTFLNVIWIVRRNAMGSPYTIYRFDPSVTPYAVTTPSMTGPVPVQDASVGSNDGPNGRVQYVPDLKGIVVQPNWGGNTYFMRTA